MLIVGLTGNIASGKTEVARLLAAMGATVIEADVLARDAVRPGSAALDAIVARWGDAILLPDGTLDRARMRRIVFADPAELAALNAIVHPVVRRLREAAVAEARDRGDAVVVADIPLLFEADLVDTVDRVVLVDAPEAVRLERLVRHRGLDEAEARRMMAAQMPSAGKRARADVVIDNDGTLADLRAKVERAWSRLAP